MTSAEEFWERLLSAYEVGPYERWMRLIKQRDLENRIAGLRESLESFDISHEAVLIERDIERRITELEKELKQ